MPGCALAAASRTFFVRRLVSLSPNGGLSIHAFAATLALRLMLRKGVLTRSLRCASGCGLRAENPCGSVAAGLTGRTAQTDAALEEVMKKAIKKLSPREALELQKLVAEVARIQAECEKLKAEARKITSDRAYLIITGVSAIATAVSAVAVSIR